MHTRAHAHACPCSSIASVQTVWNDGRQVHILEGVQPTLSPTGRPGGASHAVMCYVFVMFYVLCDSRDAKSEPLLNNKLVQLVPCMLAGGWVLRMS